MKKILSIVLASTFAIGLTAASMAQDAPEKRRPERPIRRAAEKAVEAASENAKVGEAAPNFTLKTADGKDWSLSDAKGKVVVFEWINPECPVCEGVMKDGAVAVERVDLVVAARRRRRYGGSDAEPRHVPR